MRKLIRAKKSTTRAKKSASATKAIRNQAMFLVGIGVVAAAVMVIAGRQSDLPSQVARVDVQQADVAPFEVRTPAASGASTRAMVKTTLAADTTAGGDVDPAATPAGPNLSSVTITGCLEQAHEAFRLKDTTGVEAAKSRSWKSGFFKKSSASIQVVDAANRLQLPAHVGQRVSVTGAIVGREMQGRSLKRIAASCDIEPVRGSGLKTVARAEN